MILASKRQSAYVAVMNILLNYF
ncbi:hypothetical protein ESCNG_30114 [Neisseria gonorrhoeae]|uniref:Uncharacterized protein n=1 Tax=Neisseria gonorrhoeae TaxID=485 RepID=A0AB74EMG5_NEIGO|nr:hypothetical protein ESCNG_10114 [Neisseria gonorrhoeae]SCW08643.1 hypothetical protein ESCNG_110059 [Neisseria gonorrhoeae]SCW14312.1 hypothetical protein ESCNG_30114 [Neisseria gonorrhoeae]SCW15981.1 hypothetical protein ESCNG_40058 [Neisseria gonorrhoeae]